LTTRSASALIRVSSITPAAADTPPQRHRTVEIEITARAGTV
jgi:hypothetical protein